MIKFISGVVPSPPDDRDFIYSSIKPITAILPSKFLLKEWDVNDQKQYGSCVGQACSGIKDYQESDEWSEVIDTSPLFVYSKCKELDGLKEPGTFPRFAMKVLTDYGICLEKDFLYSLIKDDVNPPQPSKEIENKASKYKIKSYARVYTVEEIKNALINDGPILTAFVWFSNMNEPEYGGFLPMPNGYLLGGHALVITGWDDNLIHTYQISYKNKKTYKGFFRIRNSWGNSWGDNGYCWVPYDFFIEKLDNGIPYVTENWTTVDIIVNPKPQPPKEEKKVIKMKIGEKEYYINDQKLEMDTTPIIQNNRTLVPVRFIAEALNCTVDYNAKTQEITITQN
jgi:hypothetical protein